MACIHAEIPGSDPCDRYSSGGCKTQIGQNSRRYKSQTVRKSGWTNAHHAGAAAEHLVACDLYDHKALELTWPDNPHSYDDMHVRFKSGWFGVQVKVGEENARTGTVTLHTRGNKIKSDIIAVVGLRDRRIRYLPNTKEVPEELRATV